MTRTDRGAERRRLLEAVRSEDSEAPTDDEAERSEERLEPRPDGGTVTLAAPLYHCTDCDRTYLTAPSACDSCGKGSFEERTPE